MKVRPKVIVVKEQFKPLEMKVFDSKNRVNLGEKVRQLFSGKMKADSFQVFIGNQGDLLLRPVANIPSRELWLYQNPTAFKQVKKGLEEIKTGKVEKVSDLDKFFDEL